MHNYTIKDIKNLILPNHFEVGDFLLYKPVYVMVFFIYQLLRINGDEYTIRYISHVGQFNPESMRNNIVRIQYNTFFKKHFTKINNHEKLKNKHLIIGIYLVLFALILTGCADNEAITCLTGHTYGFWGGFWHGWIGIFDFIGMLIWDDVAVYAPNNNGAWYAFGFILGSGGLGFGLGRRE